MIRITIHHADDDLTLKVEGSVAGAWVGELEACWLQTRPALGPMQLRIDLRGVCQLDERGHELMARMYADGAHFVAAGCVMREVLREIAAADRPTYIERT